MCQETRLFKKQNKTLRIISVSKAPAAAAALSCLSSVCSTEIETYIPTIAHKLTI